jgi:hypothetical protein
MTEKSNEKPKLELVEEPPITAEDQAGIDQDELEYNRLRCDLPGITGAAAQGIVAIAVSKIPTKNEFFRTSPVFRPEVKLVNVEVGMDRQYFAVDPSMEVPLHGIGINYTKHILYLTISPRGAIHVIPISCETENEYARTKEIGLLDGVKGWVRLYTDQENKVYKVFPAPGDRYDEPQWPQLSEAKIFRLSFRDKGRLIDSTEHELFKKWAARDKD